MDGAAFCGMVFGDEEAPSFGSFVDPHWGPSKKSAFTAPYNDVLDKGYMITAGAPIYIEDTYFTSIGIDISLADQAENFGLQVTERSTWAVLTPSGDIVLEDPTFLTLIWGDDTPEYHHLESSTTANFSDWKGFEFSDEVGRTTIMISGEEWIISYINNVELGWILTLWVPSIELANGAMFITPTVTSSPVLDQSTDQQSATIENDSRFNLVTYFQIGVSWLAPMDPIYSKSGEIKEFNFTFAPDGLEPGTYTATIIAVTVDNDIGICFYNEAIIIVTIRVTAGDEGIPTIISIIVYFVAAIGILACLVVMGLVWYHREKPYIKGIAVPYVLINLFGGILVCIAPILVAPLSRNCFAGLCLFTIGFCFFFSSLIVKSWRLTVIKRGVKNLKLKTIANTTLVITLAVFLVIQGIILGVWGGISLPYTETVLLDTAENTIIERCSWGEHEVPFLIVEAVFLGVLLFTGIILARKAQNFFGIRTVEEAPEIFFAIYNFSVSLVIVIILFVVTRNSPIAWILIIAVGLVLAVLFSVGGLYFVRFFRIIVMDDPGTTTPPPISNDMSTTSGTVKSGISEIHT
eukprot:TRINITY_DN15281_c0_g1_i1.p1 TRINITY_DN15281_c0_g1~~TRINITY_DN15281_c0_g1_i1.p1  ORF type:complete len:666 (+),score=99.80 TRINITY_DN15281_c0_g1_i1:269-1999(+)